MPMQVNGTVDRAAPRTLRLDDRDNVIVAVDALTPGMEARGVAATIRIPRGHKMASAKIAKGEPVLKFGQIIGFATQDIAPGEHVHTENCGFAAFERDYAFCQDARPEPLLPPEARATFEGFRRANGRAGTRNYLGVVTSVNCSATVARFIAEEVRRSGLLDDYPTVDGIIPLVHGTGCGIDYNGETFEVLKRTTWGYACNPNMAGVLVVGLGCEGFQIARMKEATASSRATRSGHSLFRRPAARGRQLQPVSTRSAPCCRSQPGRGARRFPRPS